MLPYHRIRSEVGRALVVVSGASSYSGGQNRRQTARPSGIAVAAFAAGLASCSSLGLPFGPDVGTTSAIPTVVSAADLVAPSDWETVRKTIATIPSGQTKTVQWSNGTTGSTGALTVLGVTAVPPATCRPFSTTVSDPRGVRRYGGRARCPGGGGWQTAGAGAGATRFS